MSGYLDVVVVVWKGIHSRSNTNRSSGIRGFQAAPAWVMSSGQMKLELRAVTGKNSIKGQQSILPARKCQRHPLQVRHKQDWGRGFIFSLIQAAALPGSDAGSDVVKTVSNFVI